MGSSDGTFYKAVFILGVTFTVGFVTGYKVLTIIRAFTTELDLGIIFSRQKN